MRFRQRKLKKVKKKRKKQERLSWTMIAFSAGGAIFVCAFLAFMCMQNEKAVEKTATTKLRVDLYRIGVALHQFRLDNDFYPATDQGLHALVEAPTAPPHPSSYDEEGYLEKVPNDPWGNPYVYRCPGKDAPYDLLTHGADGSPGGAKLDRDRSNREFDSPEETSPGRGEDTQNRD